jgi:hypothetical protein
MVFTLRPSVFALCGVAASSSMVDMWDMRCSQKLKKWLDDGGVWWHLLALLSNQCGQNANNGVSMVMKGAELLV